VAFWYSDQENQLPDKRHAPANPFTLAKKQHINLAGSAEAIHFIHLLVHYIHSLA
jgi:hypothetical protein